MICLLPRERHAASAISRSSRCACYAVYADADMRCHASFIAAATRHVMMSFADGGLMLMLLADERTLPPLRQRCCRFSAPLRPAAMMLCLC